MGYSTAFTGQLKFAQEPTRSELAALRQYLNKDVRELEPGIAHKFYYIDFELTDDFSGIQHSGAEKSNGMVECVNWLTEKMREQFPEFRLTGTLAAQGDESDDRWKLVMDKTGVASKVDDPPTGRRVVCPHCEKHFFLD